MRNNFFNVLYKNFPEAVKAEKNQRFNFEMFNGMIEESDGTLTEDFRKFNRHYEEFDRK